LIDVVVDDDVPPCYLFSLSSPLSHSYGQSRIPFTFNHINHILLPHTHLLSHE
jgi:hypothetical protein